MRGLWICNEALGLKVGKFLCLLSIRKFAKGEREEVGKGPGRRWEVRNERRGSAGQGEARGLGARLSQEGGLAS